MEQHAPKPQSCPPITVSVWLVLRACFELLRVDLQLTWRGFPPVYETVRNSPVRQALFISQTEEEICQAMNLACVFYFKEVRCLQRSAATTTLLRKRGLCAEMVIGVQSCPFRAHAWVELAGRIVNDKPYIAAMYTVMDRC
jgi:hypothetical protein